MQQNHREEYLESPNNLQKFKAVPSDIEEMKIVGNDSVMQLLGSASSLFKVAASTIKSGATELLKHSNTLLFQSAPLSDRCEANLSQLSDELDTPFEPENPQHVALLSELWTQQVISTSPDAGTFQKSSPLWKNAGWQTPDPSADLKSSGILALHCMIYLGNKYTVLSNDRLLRNKVNSKSNYPYAIVGVNLTLLLADLLSLKDQRYLSEQRSFWMLFEDPTAFFEIFCVCYHHIDSTWTYRKAVRSEFAKIIGLFV